MRSSVSSGRLRPGGLPWPRRRAAGERPGRPAPLEGSEEALQRAGPALLDLGERLLRGLLHVLPGALARLLDLAEQLLGLLRVLAQGRQRLLEPGASVGAGAAQALLVLLG